MAEEIPQKTENKRTGPSCTKNSVPSPISINKALALRRALIRKLNTLSNTA
jgi:hypothetical protein